MKKSKLTPEKHEKIEKILLRITVVVGIVLVILGVLILIQFFLSVIFGYDIPSRNPESSPPKAFLKEVKQTPNKKFYIRPREATLEELEKCIEEFKKPIDVVWEGEIVDSMSNGACYAIRKIPAKNNYPGEIPKFMACLPSNDYTGVFYKGKVKITGKWTGMTDMYTNTFFDGKCVPYVDIEEELEEEVFPTILNRPERFESEEAKRIKDIIPKEAFLRDYIALDGVKGYLVLYILNPKLNSMLGLWDWPYLSCPDSYYGQVIKGQYWLALVQDWTIVNEIPILFRDWENWPSYKNYKDDGSEESYSHSFLHDPNGVWREGGGLMFRQMRGVLENWNNEQRKNLDLTEKGTEMIESRQLVLEDLTGDGIANEIKFKIEYISCGNNYYTITGYDAETNKVMTYKVNDGEYSYIAYDDFNPNTKGFVVHNTGCDHGATRHNITQFQFNPQSKEYVKNFSTGMKDCSGYIRAEYVNPFPLTKGSYWIYDVSTKWTADSDGDVNKEFVWKMEVLDTAVYKDITAVHLNGFPSEFDWYNEEYSEMSDYTIITDIPENWPPEFYLLKGTDAFEQIKNKEELAEGLINNDNLWFDFPLIFEKTWGYVGGKEITRSDNYYQWYVKSEFLSNLDEIKGVMPTIIADKEYELMFYTLPAHRTINFVPGLGITGYTYVHHGTTSEAYLELIEVNIEESE